MNIDYNKLRVNPGAKVDLKDYSTSEDGGYTKKTAKEENQKKHQRPEQVSEMFYADNSQPDAHHFASTRCCRQRRRYPHM